MRTAAIVLGFFWHLVNGTVYFYYQPRPQTNEIHEIIFNGVLPPKAQAVLLTTQCLP